MNIAILGQGAWGRAVGHATAHRGHTITFISHDEPPDWPAGGCDYVLVALPVQHIRETLQRFPAPGVPVLSLSKGLEIATGQRVSQIIGEVWPGAAVGALSGPSFAKDVMADLPVTCVIAAEDEALATEFQELLHQPAFRLYRRTDLVGVEVAGALKNVYAIAGGICQGLELGESAFAGLITRCLVEMTRIGLSAGGRAETFSGLSGMGDLLLTAMSEKSRNHRVGRLMAQGMPLAEVLDAVGGVSEGVPTADAVHRNDAIAADAKPIATEMYRILYENKPLAQAIRELLERDPKSEGV